MSLMAQLPTSEVADIVCNLRSRLYINFFKRLPQEVCLKILGYLDPESLMKTALTSREWMGLAFERRLWEELYIRDGFRILRSAVESYEAALNSGGSLSVGSADSYASKRRETPLRRITPRSRPEEMDKMDLDAPMHKQTSIFGTAAGLIKEPLQIEEDTNMISPEVTPVPAFVSFGESSSSYHSQKREKRRLSTGPTSPVQQVLPENPSLVVTDRSTNHKRLNWQYLYSQRRRLEANWESEKFVNFQLPHPNHPEEAHEECIYTLQYSGKYLVSGSRDRTLRIWNIDTQRLVRAPLRAHSGSVLCLQFDADPEEDLIVSGSSDATVVLWKFSTGQVIQRLRKAHRESVLNVRFDKRVLVTCSKDKMIKIFNRHPMSPGEFGYPGMSGAVGPVPIVVDNYGFNPAPNAGLPIKPPFSVIGVLVGHNAAVNAVQIHGHEIVSASGDRNIKVWNWIEQKCTRTLGGHKKGIACVQYDGRRIVSGSSDNEVRIYDKETGLVVASLNAHSNLVRTVQAGFADLPDGAVEDAELARMTDLNYFRAVDAGIVAEDISIRGRAPNAGSRRPEDITAYGAKIPPGGGGGHFARIVSGSYDETIIIWRKDKEGVWKAQHTLRPEHAAKAAVKRSAEEDIERGVLVFKPVARAQAPSPDDSVEVLSALLPGSSHEPGSNEWYQQLVDSGFSQGPGMLSELIRRHPPLLARREFAVKLASLTQVERHVFQATISQATLNRVSFSEASTSSVGFGSATATTAHPSAYTTSPAPATVILPSIANLLSSTTSTTTAVAPPDTPAAPATLPVPSGNHAPAANAQPNMARVFKLQFDARRIICCSQTSTIVGWDFANGDKSLEEASRFFAPIE